MITSQFAVVALLKTVFTGKSVYTQVPPEGTSYPCFQVTEISNDSTRVLAGSKSSNTSVVRVSIFVTDLSGLGAILASIENLDNTKNADFQRIYAQYVLTEPPGDGDVVTRAFYDLTLYRGK